MLRQIEVSIANGKTTPQACKEAEITMQTFYRSHLWVSGEAYEPLRNSNQRALPAAA